MNTTITTKYERRIAFSNTHLSVIDTKRGREINARLTDDERRTLAAALDPDRATGGQWTRDDLPSEVPSGIPTPYVMPGGMRDHLAEWLNAHHPKPAPYDQGGWPEGWQTAANLEARAVAAEHARDAALAVTMKSEKEKLDLRDELVATQEHGAKAVHERDELRDDAVNHAYWVANQLDCHVDHLDGLTLVEMAIRVVAKAERESDEADRRTAAAEADRDRWKLHHDRVDGQWAKAEREVTRLRGTGAVTKADIEKAIRPAFEGWATQLEGPMDRAVDRLWALHEGAAPAVHVVRESDLPEVERDEDGNWVRGDLLVYGRSAELEMVRQHAASALETVADCEAVARAIEAEQTVDPVEAKAREMLGVAYPGTDGAWPLMREDEREGYRRLAAHVLGQEADQ